MIEGEDFGQPFFCRDGSDGLSKKVCVKYLWAKLIPFNR
jgi:hypothetical protein